MNESTNRAVKPPSKFSFAIWSTLMLLSAILLVGCDQLGAGRDSGQEAATRAVEGEEREATRTPRPVLTAGTTILAEGELVAVNPQLPLAFAASGRLLELYVESGDEVMEGDLVAILDDEDLHAALVDAELAVRQAENNLDQAQLSLNNLLNWEPDEAVVAQAEASLAAAESGLENAQSQDSAAYSNVTTARVRLEQAQRSLERAQEEYETAFDPGRDWEQYIDDPSCRTGEQHPNCTGEPYSDRIKRDREWAPINLRNAEDELEMAQANYNLAVASINDDSAVSAEANIASAQQALNQALTGPRIEEIDASRLQLEQAQLSLAQAQINRDKAEDALADTQLYAPQAGTILSVESVPGSFIGSGTTVATMLDTSDLQFQTNNFSERDLAQVAADQPVVVTLKAFPNDVLDGKVLRVVPLAEGAIGDAATFTVVISLESTDLDLLPGMTGRVEISS
jgi:multidrug efflux pump subunit AcrA (membrane-fusion protein)